MTICICLSPFENKFCLKINSLKLIISVINISVTQLASSGISFWSSWSITALLKFFNLWKICFSKNRVENILTCMLKLKTRRETINLKYTGYSKSVYQVHVLTPRALARHLKNSYQNISEVSTGIMHWINTNVNKNCL